MAIRKTSAKAATAAKMTVASKPVETVVEAGKETVETVVKAGAEAASAGLDATVILAAVAALANLVRCSFHQVRWWLKSS